MRGSWLAMVMQVGVGLAALSALLVSAGRAPARTGDGIITFSVDTGYGDFHVFGLDADSGLTAPLLDTRAYSYCALWSPNGKHAAIQVYGRSGTWMHLVSLEDDDGLAVQERVDLQLWSRRLADGIAWSPDSRQLAVWVHRSGILWLLVRDLASGSTRSFTATIAGTSVFQPTWSPDGRQLAFLALDRPANAVHIYTTDVEYGTLRHVARLDNQDALLLGWSADGRQLMLTRIDGAFHLLDASSGQMQQLISEGLAYGPIERAPGGDLVAFSGYAEDQGSGMYVLDMGSAGLRRVFELDDWQAVGDFAWSPRGDTLAFVTHSTGNSRSRPGTLYRVSADGSDLHSLATLSASRSAFIAWSPDGRRLAFLEQEGLYVVDVDGGNLRRLTSSPMRAQRGCLGWGQ